MATDATLVETHDTPGHDTLVPDPQVQKEFGVTAMSIWRWDRDPELIKLGWPPPIRIRSRNQEGRVPLPVEAVLGIYTALATSGYRALLYRRWPHPPRP
jgi:hypothetical protein